MNAKQPKIEGRATELGKENQRLTAELAELRRVSATAITQYEENKQLKASNASLTMRPPWQWSSTTSSPVNECGAVNSSARPWSSGAPPASRNVHSSA